jgi:copper chaperone
VGAKMANIKIKTNGMHCSSCEMLVKDSLEELDGVKSAKADYESGIIEVDFDDAEIDENAIKSAISNEGYEPE